LWFVSSIFMRYIAMYNSPISREYFCFLVCILYTAISRWNGFSAIYFSANLLAIFLQDLWIFWEHFPYIYICEFARSSDIIYLHILCPYEYLLPECFSEIWLHINIHIYVYVLYTYIYIYTNVYIYIYICVCVCTHTHIYMYMYVSGWFPCYVSFPLCLHLLHCLAVFIFMLPCIEPVLMFLHLTSYCLVLEPLKHFPTVLLCCVFLDACICDQHWAALSLYIPLAFLVGWALL